MSNFTFEPDERAGWAKNADFETLGWMPVGVVFEGQEIDVCGLNPWGSATRDWRPLRKWIVVSHPAYPTQRHRADAYEITAPDGRVVTFAATELSNGVWGFFVPAGL